MDCTTMPWGFPQASHFMMRATIPSLSAVDLRWVASDDHSPRDELGPIVNAGRDTIPTRASLLRSQAM
jgi:hypothetical protein